MSIERRVQPLLDLTRYSDQTLKKVALFASGTFLNVLHTCTIHFCTNIIK